MCRGHTHTLEHWTAYRNFIKATSTSAVNVMAAPDELKIQRLLVEIPTLKGDMEYLVEWLDTLLLHKHAPILASREHRGKYSRIDAKLYGAKATALYWQVAWIHTWETEEAMQNQPE